MLGHDLLIIFLSLPPLLLALTGHEFFHAYVALRMGDPTAKYAGRLSFNPLRHIDPLGLIALILFHFGWAKPVPVNPLHFTNYRQGMFWTTVAGPLANLIMAVFFGLVIRFLPAQPSNNFLLPLWLMAQLGMSYNLILFAFNLIPIPPLDGSKALFSILPNRYAALEYWLTRHGFFILIGLILLERLTGVPIFWGWINPIKNIIGRLLAGVPPLL